MREIVILVPEIEPDQNIEIEVHINGRKKALSYKVELLQWEAEEELAEDRVTILQKHLKDYDKNWELVEIGAPDKSNIPLVFRKNPLISKQKDQESDEDKK